MPPPAPQRARQPHQLPPGRHGLDRGFVVSNQRERILDAVADVVSLLGYNAVTIEDITATAGVSRRTFYDIFSNKEEAFLAAYDAVAAQLEEQVVAAAAQAKDFPGRVRAALTIGMEFLASEPAFADLCVVEILAAGAHATDRRAQTMRRLAGLIDAAAPRTSGSQPPAVTSEALVGGIYEVVYSRLVQGEARQLPDLVGDLTFAVLLPYMGFEAAKAGSTP